MKNPTSREIRKAFLDYFGKHGHAAVSSSSLIPHDDPTLLFTNAGMNQFKNLFLGLEKRDYKRAVTAQKCVRAGGKHNDLENVGFTARHLTFFEMLGNFSFGDYFKREAIHFAWELVTKEFGLDKKRLYVSVFKNDDEAADIWHTQEGVPKDRIYRLGEKDNFWRMGETGPCGPCSEIFYDLGPDVPGDPKDNVMGGDGDRFAEFWNLVFMQFNEAAGGMTPLPNPSIDTGLGLERLTMILQGKISIYDTDGFQDLIETACHLSGVEYVKAPAHARAEDLRRLEANNAALRILADHSRSIAFLLADGVLPSNEGRGYVLRRILRRALRYGRSLVDHKSVLPELVMRVVEQMGDVYPELKARRQVLKESVTEEENRFLATLDQGTGILNDEITKASGRGIKTLPGEVVFKLYDTFGFPVDLTRIMAKEKGFSIDEAGFEQHMDSAREQAKKSWKGKGTSADQALLLKVATEIASKHGETKFTGYETLVQEGQILWLGQQEKEGAKQVTRVTAGDEAIVVCDRTPVYAEGGGQVADEGVIFASASSADIIGCNKMNGVFFHFVKIREGNFQVGQTVKLLVTDSTRRGTAANHSATHLLHWALRKTLGPHVAQAGSLVESERLRFDFTHPKPVTAEEIKKIEHLVNEEIAKASSVQTRHMPLKSALKEGAIAMFGEKYGDDVRVVGMGESLELCGGTHVANTSMIRVFTITSESGVSSGVRRIEALTGDGATQYLLASARENHSVRQNLGLPLHRSNESESPSELLDWIESKKSEIKNLERQIQILKGNQISLDSFLNNARTFSKNGKSGRLVFADVTVDDRKVLTDLSDRLRDRVGSGVVIVVGTADNAHPIIVSVSKDWAGQLHAGNLLRELASEMGGKGGGRPDFAQGAAPDRSKLPSAFAKAEALIN